MQAASLCPQCEAPIEADAATWMAATLCCHQCGAAIKRAEASTAVLLAPELDDELSPDFDETKNWGRVTPSDNVDTQGARLDVSSASLEGVECGRRSQFWMGAIAGATTALIAVALCWWLFVENRRSPDLDAPKAVAISETTESPTLAAAPFGARQAKASQTSWAKHRRIPVQITNSIGIKLALIPASPQTAPFYLGVYEVTQGEYQAIVNANPSHFSANGAGAASVAGIDTERLPVENVTLEHAQLFCKLLSETSSEKAEGRRYRLPTLDEWSFACLAGAIGHYHTGEAVTLAQANFNGRFAPNGEARTTPLRRTAIVGSYPANAFGLHDMHGNVAEFCFDLRAPRGVDPAAARGGSWWHSAPGLSVREVTRLSTGNRNIYDGFRIALPIDPEPPTDDSAFSTEAAERIESFPTENSRILFRDERLTLTAVNDAENLYVQAIVSSEDVTRDVALNANHSAILALDVDADQKPTPFADRNYCVQFNEPRAHYHWLQAGGALSRALIDTDARGRIEADVDDEHQDTTVCRFIIPLAEIEKRPGDEVRFAFFRGSSDASFRVNSLGLPHSENLNLWSAAAIEKHHSLRLVQPLVVGEAPTK